MTTNEMKTALEQCQNEMQIVMDDRFMEGYRAATDYALTFLKTLSEEIYREDDLFANDECYLEDSDDCETIDFSDWQE